MPENEGEMAHPHLPRITPGVSVKILLERRQTLLEMVSVERIPSRMAPRMAIPSALVRSPAVANVAVEAVAVLPVADEVASEVLAEAVVEGDHSGVVKVRLRHQLEASHRSSPSAPLHPY